MLCIDTASQFIFRAMTVQLCNSEDIFTGPFAIVMCDTALPVERAREDVM
jgi:hypothetical protein